MLTIARPTVLALLAALLFAACGDDGGQPEAADQGGGVPVSCNSLGELQAYRYRVAVRFVSPAATAAPQGTGEPLTAFIDALSGLFSDFTLEGAYLAPDRTQAILRFENEELELRSIGSEAWVRVGTTWQPEDAGDAQLLTPAVVCRDIISAITPALAEVEPEAVTLNGLQTNHYRLTQADLTGTAPLSGIPVGTEYAVDLWLAEEGRFPVQLRIVSSEPQGPAGTSNYQLSMEIRDINDRGIRIERPVP